MQQMQYHGIASYKFEYQLSTGGDWQIALDTTLSTDTSYDYMYEGLTGGKGYDLRVTVTDNAGNIGSGTNTVSTKKPEKNPGGVIDNIESDPIIYPGDCGGLDLSLSGQKVQLECDLQNVKFHWTYRPRYNTHIQSYSTTLLDYIRTG